MECDYASNPPIVAQHISRKKPRLLIRRFRSCRVFRSLNRRPPTSTSAVDEWRTNLQGTGRACGTGFLSARKKGQTVRRLLLLPLFQIREHGCPALPLPLPSVEGSAVFLPGRDDKLVAGTRGRLALRLKAPDRRAGSSSPRPAAALPERYRANRRRPRLPEAARARARSTDRGERAGAPEHALARFIQHGVRKW